MLGVALAHHLEPFHGVARGVLNARDIDTAHFLIGFEHGRNLIARVAEALELARQLDGVVERELGARPDGDCH